MTRPAPRLDLSPFQRFLGLVLEDWSEGRVRLRLPFRDELRRRDDSDWLHGGVLSALVDIAGNYAVATRTGSGVPTVDMRVDYLRPARRGDVVAAARALKVGRGLAVADVEVTDASGAIVVVGRATYSTAAVQSGPTR
ncbi:MAG: PaaI family thioesterase [Vicinamibacterales bacterium]